MMKGPCIAILGCLALCVLTALSTLPAQARLLSAGGWKITGPDGKRITSITDNNLETVWTSSTPQTPGMAIEIDLGQPTVIQRLYMTPGVEESHSPIALRLSAGMTRDTLEPFWEKDTSQNTDLNIKFAPVTARYLRLEVTAGSSLPWSIAELELYGSTDKAAFEKGDAVVLPPRARPTLQLAARELQYYLGELTGRPLPIITPADEGAYPGTLYTIVDLKPLAQTYDEMVKNQASGALPANVNVEHEGRSVLFKSWPYRDVLYSVWEFLERQGVHWVFPDAHGDYVPAGKGVNLDILPLRYTPTSTRRYANFEIHANSGASENDYTLFFARNRWSTNWNPVAALGGNEVPRNPYAAPQVRGDDFTGYPHNGCLVTNDALQQHPEWCGMYSEERWKGKYELGKRLGPWQGGPQFCMTAPGVAAYVAQRIIDSVHGDPDAEGTVNLLPWDSVRYCECPDCLKAIEPLEKEDLTFAANSDINHSDLYFGFVKRVADLVYAAMPKVRIRTLAYAENHKAPRFITMPPNVIVEVCQYGSRNLPIESPLNAEMKQRMLDWRQKATTLEDYEYVLIHTERSDFKMPVPLVTAIVSRSKFLYSLHAFEGGTQWFGETTYVPWNIYAYPRMLWNINTTADQLLHDFFQSYFQESAEPMLLYYKTLEDHLIANNIDLHYFMYDYAFKKDCLPPDVEKKMAGYLAQAEKQAKYWVVKKRLHEMREGFQYMLDQRAVSELVGR